MRSLLFSLIVAGAMGTLAGATSPSPPQAVQTQGGRGAGPGAPPATATGLLMGQVIDGVSGKPVPEAVVALTGGGGRGAAVSPGPGAPRVIVDGQGRFLFRDLPAGTFTLGATRVGYFGGISGQRTPTGPSRPVELGDGERLGDVTLRLWPYASVSGTVLDESNAPLGGIEATLLRRTAVNGRWQWASADSATTDDRGAYRFGTVIPGSYVVEVRSSGGPGEQLIMSLLMADEAAMLKMLPKILERGQESLVIDPTVHLYPATFYPGASSAAQATVFTVAPGAERTGIDFHVRPVSARSVAGTATGLDPANTSLTLTLKPADAAADSNITSKSLDPNGRFVFSGVAPGQYVIEAVSRPRMTAASIAAMSAGRGGPGGATAPAPAAPAEPTLCATVPITVGDRNISDLSIALHAGGRVSGHVEFDGGIERPTPDQLLQITVTLAPLDGTGDGQMISPGRLEADGTFRTASVAPGRYLLRIGPVAGARAGGPGVAGRGSAGPTGLWRPRSAMFDGRDALDQPLELDAADIDSVVITFTDQRVPTLSGTVRDGNGTADAAAVILLFPTDSRLWADLSATSRRVKQARTTRAGSYVIPGLPAGEYFVAVGTDDMLVDWQAPGALELLSRRATRVQLTDGQTQTLDLKSAAVRGSYVEADLQVGRSNAVLHNRQNGRPEGRPLRTIKSGGR